MKGRGRDCEEVGDRTILEIVILENIKAYYKGFITCNDQRNLGDITPFLLMQMEMIFCAMKDLKESL